MPPLTASQRAAVGRRTTASSRSRLLARIRGTPAPGTPAAPQFAPPAITPEDAFALNPAAEASREQIRANYGNTMEDYGLARTRGAFDFAQGNQQQTQDYHTALANLNRRYEQLAQTQTQGAYSSEAAGAPIGSTLQEQARLRSQNLNLAQQPVDTSYNRGMGNRAKGYERTFGTEGRVTLGERRAGQNLGLQEYGLYQQAVAGLLNQGYVPAPGARIPAPTPQGVSRAPGPQANPYAPPIAIHKLNNGQYATSVNGRTYQFSATPGQKVTIGGRQMVIPA